MPPDDADVPAPDLNPHRGAYRAAAERAAADNVLLPGEDERTTDLEDVLHWLAVYRELLTFKQELIGSTNAEAARLVSADAHEEVASTDFLVLEAERARFVRRLAFWEAAEARLR